MSLPIAKTVDQEYNHVVNLAYNDKIKCDKVG